MLVTVVTVYRNESCEHYVGVIEGRLTEEQRNTIATGHECARATQASDDDGDDDDGQDMVFFREIDTVKPEALSNVLNVDGENHPLIT